MAVRITYFVHGATTDNEQHRTTGWNPGELSSIGIQQAKDLGDLVKDQQFAVIISSDLARAAESAQLGFGGKYPIMHDTRLRECNYGDLNGAEESVRGPISQYVQTPYPNGESYRDVERRVRLFLHALAEQYDGKHVALMSHHAPQLSLEVILKGKTWQEAIDSDWRNDKRWRAGWEYVIPDTWSQQ